MSKMGFEVEILYRSNKYYDIKHIKNVKIIQYSEINSKYVPFFKLKLFVKNIFTKDVFYFVWNETLLPFYFDFVLIRMAGKKLIIMHCGDDVRYRPLSNKIFKNFSLGPLDVRNTYRGEFLKKFYFQFMSEMTGQVISFRDQTTFQFGKLIHYYFPQEQISPKSVSVSPIVKIIHAPSDRVIKGTNYVLEAVEILRKRNIPFEFELIENKGNEYVLKSLVECDILIDQPSCWTGRLAVEGCAASCCVIGGNNREFADRCSSPVIQFHRNSEQLAQIIEDLINNPKYLSDKKSECYDFWNTYYSPAAFESMLREILEGGGKYFFPVQNQKNILLEAPINNFQKIFLTIFYHPRNN